jgi:hypothetical protein
MFSLSPDERISHWRQFRDSLETSDDPLQAVVEFWDHPPFIPYNKNVDPYNQRSWPTPWEIILHNKYDDFTKAVMMGWSLKYTNRYAKSDIHIQTIVDNAQNLVYNVVCVDNKWVLNFKDSTPVEANKVPGSFRLENLVVLERPK